MDGVIIDSEMNYLKEIEMYLDTRHPNHTIRKEDLYCLVGVSWEEHYRYLARLIGGDINPIELRKDFDEYESKISRDYNQWIFPDVKASLEAILDNDYQIALGSNSSTKTVEKVLETLNIKHKFKHAMSGDQFTQGKPSPEMYNYIINDLGFKPEETIIIEDSPSGIRAGKAAHADVVAIYDQFFNMDQSEADYVVQDFKQLEKLLKI